MRTAVYVLATCLFVFPYKAQVHQADSSALKTLFLIQKHAERLFKNTSVKIPTASHDSLLAALETLLQSKDPLLLPWDSLKSHFSVLIPANRRLLLLTWNLPELNECNRFYGFLWQQAILKKKQFWQHKKHTAETLSNPLYRLHENTNWLKQKSPELYTGSAEQWPGMLYTAIVPADGYYLLLGWNGKDAYTQFKGIDVLWFDAEHQPHFGKPVFKIPKKNPKRLLFEYSKEAQMSLRYDSWSRRIIYSHLGPRDENPTLIGQFAFYGPDGSFDALYERDNRWILEEAIDIRNKRSKLDNAPKPDTDQQMQLYPIK
jgi:hypothetical protein